jgi:hypothetical protein
VDTQRQVDYTNDAQRRVTAESEILVTTLSLTVPAGDVGGLLDPSVVRVLAAFNGTTEQVRMTPGGYIRARSGGDALSTDTDALYTIIGRHLYLLPVPTADTVLTLICSIRSHDYTSAAALEVGGEYARVVERLAAAYALLDDGQPELAQQAMADYEADMQRLRLRAKRRATSIGTTRIRRRGVNP